MIIRIIQHKTTKIPRGNIYKNTHKERNIPRAGCCGSGGGDWWLLPCDDACMMASSQLGCNG